ncbi:regulatory protein RecX [Carboxydothermus islandicus]|uniref:Regulatory protein RecX n=1 Tax=Carboxydothermus islandicus TaxID=661089 RepID=A0A1L8D585_9THEO|nr:regulatory protein RecX [Carboxydothermus islandicus]GAV26318.1 regulatory protein RecX [Carboxydothermus islandicus]
MSSRAYQKALNYLSRALRTTAEVRQYLSRNGFPNEEIEEVISKLTAIGYLDDRRYLENYLLSEKALRYGINKIKFKLLQKGLDLEHLNNLPVDEEEEVNKAKEILLKKYKQLDPMDYGKYYRFLVGRGFSPAVARKAVFLTDDKDNG